MLLQFVTATPRVGPRREGHGDISISHVAEHHETAFTILLIFCESIILNTYLYLHIYRSGVVSLI